MSFELEAEMVQKEQEVLTIFYVLASLMLHMGKCYHFAILKSEAESSQILHHDY